MWKHRYLIAQLVTREITQRYRGSYLGLLWSFVTPVLLLLVYTFVFSVVMKVRWGSPNDEATAPGVFAITVFAGLIPFTLFSEMITRAPTLVLAVPNYVKRVVFPLEILPVVALGSALVHSLVSLGVLLLGLLLLNGQISLAWMLVPLAYVPLLLLCLGLCWTLASLGVYVRDLAQGVGLAVQILFFLSPVFYPISAVPESLRVFVNLNPLAAILTDFRRALLWGEALAWTTWGAWTALCALLAVAGYVWFVKTKSGFADVM